jgi:hypothetical protein
MTARSVLASRARSAGKAGMAIAQQLDPSRFALIGLPLENSAIGFVAVYRAANAPRLSVLLSRLNAARVTVRLWALDEVAHELQPFTVGCGTGARFTLLNRLIETIPAVDRRGALIISDDDYRFRVGDLQQLVAVGSAFDLDVWQPAHIRNSWASSPFVRRRGGVVLRRTSFVEQGPVLVLSERAQHSVLPLPEDLGMGWGAEIRWARVYAEHSLHVGIVDAVAIRHLAPIGGYDRSAQRDQLNRLLYEAGMADIADLQTEYSRVPAFAGRLPLRGR